MGKDALPGVDIADHPGEGWKPLLESSGDWLAAIMNARPESAWRVPGLIEKHVDTDELFVLVAGRAYMITAEKGEKPGQLYQAEMKPNILYLVRTSVWHTTPMTPDARFIIIEKKGMTKNSTVRVPLTAEQKADIVIQ